MVETSKKRTLVDVILARAFFFGLLFILTVISLNGAFAVGLEGCYTYAGGSPDLFCQDDVLEEDALADYELLVGDGLFDDYFFPGQSCDVFPDLCEEVTCSLDCSTQAIGSCEFEGGQAVPDDEYDLWCSWGCCQIPSGYCGQVDLRSVCVEEASYQGYSIDEVTYISSAYSPITTDECVDLCVAGLEDASLSGYIFDAADGVTPIEGATVELRSGVTAQSDVAGFYQFQTVSPGTYVVSVSATGYSGASQTITLESGEVEELDFTLSVADQVASLSGTVVDEFGVAVADVSLCWTGPGVGCTTSAVDGSYLVSEILLGDYTFTLSKFGYETSSDSLSIQSDLVYDFVLFSQPFQGISGSTWIDPEGDGLLLGGTDYLQYGVSIFVDGIYRGSSQYPDGDFNIYLDEGDYTITASYLDFVSPEYSVTVLAGQSSSVDPVLTQYIGECSYGQPDESKPVAELHAVAVAGSLAVDLSWDKPCAEVSGYNLYRDGELHMQLSPFALSFTDSIDLEWGMGYIYGIQAIYTDGPMIDDQPQTRFSEITETSITLGNAACEGKEPGDLFCLADDLKSTYTCDIFNTLLISTSCAALDTSTSDYYCVESSPGFATCKDAGMCNAFTLGADPFGLYHSEEVCYGPYLGAESGYENYCYYDYTSGVVDQCTSCVEVESCFDYVSEGACGINNCLGVGCQWINGSSSSGEGDISAYEEESEPFLDYGYLFPVSEETGHGYCAPLEYEEDDNCALCSPGSSLFENNLCTPEVCTELGACYSDKDLPLSTCHSCGEESSPEVNCYSYASELECTAGSPTVNDNGQILRSADSCTWGACAWIADDFDPAGGYCIKDGDANRIDDCSEFVSGDYSSCIADTAPPVTSLQAEGFAIVSETFSQLEFVAVDNERMGSLWFCLESADASDCTDFEAADYPFTLQGEEALLELNMSESSFLQSELVDGETYKLRFYSVDEFYNQESVQEAFVFVDNKLPDFTVVTEPSIDGDVVDLLVYLTDLSEPVSCSFTLEEILPPAAEQVIGFERDEDKEYTFVGLGATLAELSVSCTDDHGNSFVHEETLSFDLEQDISIVYPPLGGSVSETTIIFEIETAVSASCDLYYDNDGDLIFDYLSNFNSIDIDNKVHETNPIPGFFEGEYVGNLQVICRESLDQSQVLEDYFDFVVDFTGPETQIILTEGTREETPIAYGWEEYFISEVQVDFSCEADGFDCDQSFYCLGEGCEFASAPGYVEYTGSGSLFVNETTEICYYSTDLGGSTVYPTCGTIIVEGFGINLVQPDPYFYQGEVYGVSAADSFDWEVMSKIDTQGCVFDFTSEFDYHGVPLIRTFSESLSGENYYLYSPFPGDGASAYDAIGGLKVLYVKCEDYQGEIGPAQKMNLEFDPSAPSISDAYAEPDFITEGVVTHLYVTTDDPTLCRYSDNSDGDGSTEFATMPFSFPGYDEGELHLAHQDDFIFSFVGATRDYSLNVQCMNGAGDLSEVETIDFSVDYTVAGNIMSVAPSGFISGENVTLLVETNKNGVCSYEENGSSVDFEVTGGTSHSHLIGSLEEGDYQYLVTCHIAENVRTAEIIFTVDQTAPTVTMVEDGSYSCSLEQVSIYVYTDEENISTYYYQLYQGESDLGESSLSTYFTTTNDTAPDDEEAVLIGEGTLLGDNGTVITGLSLEENESYFVKVAASDVAGNTGGYTSSDGFIASGSDLTVCAADGDAPNVRVQTNSSSCTEVTAEIICEDELACSSISYGQSTSSETCSADSSYYGQKLSFSSSGWVCYSASDPSDNQENGSAQITFSDNDGDGISDSCDLCSGTLSGQDVDAEGCGLGQVPDDERTNDEDNDGLPDHWERVYHREGVCPLFAEAIDSDSNGITDTDEDYDGDGYTNYEEYIAGLDPCVADAPSTFIDDNDLDSELLGLPGSGEGKEGADVVAIIFFVIGALFMLGGAGYLYYYYNYTPEGKVLLKQGGKGSLRGVGSGGALGSSVGGGLYRQGIGSRSAGAGLGGSGARAGCGATGVAGGGLLDSMRRRVSSRKRSRERKLRSLQRQNVFGSFSKESGEFPHFKDILSSRKSHHAKVGDLVERYNDHHDVVQQGLKKEEKALFRRLDKISSEAEKKKQSVRATVGKDEAKDIFEKLKKLSEKRKSS